MSKMSLIGPAGVVTHDLILDEIIYLLVNVLVYSHSSEDLIVSGQHVSMVEPSPTGSVAFILRTP